MKFHTLAAASLMLALGSTPSHAAIYIAQFGGALGLAYGGQTFSGTFNFDDSVPVSSDGYHHDAISNFILQSDAFIAALGSTTAKISSGGITFSTVYIFNGQNYVQGQGLLYNLSANKDINGSSITLLFPKNTFDGNTIPTDVTGFIPSEYSLMIKLTKMDYGLYGKITSFSIARVGDYNPSGVPEPANWALLIGGMGLTGGALRRHRAFSARARTA